MFLKVTLAEILTFMGETEKSNVLMTLPKLKKTITQPKTPDVRMTMSTGGSPILYIRNVNDPGRDP
jgi:hypothetical protein